MACSITEAGSTSASQHRLPYSPTNFLVQKGMSALPPKADMCSANRNVRFGPKADVETRYKGCLNYFRHRLGRTFVDDDFRAAPGRPPISCHPPTSPRSLLSADLRTQAKCYSTSQSADASCHVPRVRGYDSATHIHGRQSVGSRDRPWKQAALVV